MRNAVITFAVVASVALGGCGEEGGRSSSEAPNCEVEAPDLIGLKEPDAKAQIRALGLESRTKLRCSRVPVFDDRPPCTGGLTVDDQVPDPGTEVPPDATITMYIE